MADTAGQLKRFLNGAKTPAAAMLVSGIALVLVSAGVSYYINRNKETLDSSLAIILVLAAQALGLALNGIILGWSGYRAVKRGFSILESAGVGALSAALGSVSYNLVGMIVSVAIAGAGTLGAGILNALIGALIWTIAGALFATAGAFYAQGK